MPRAGVRAYVVERCRVLRSALLDARAASPDEIAAYWPGGDENPDTSLRGWIFCYGNLGRFSGRAEAADRSDARPADELTRALLAEPRTVALAAPVTIDGAAVAELTVGYKSWHALYAMAALARTATALLQLLPDVEATPGGPAAWELAAEARTWIDRIQRTLVWGACHPGARTPWDPTTERWPTPPAWTETLAVSDVLAVQRAFAEVHARALLAVAPFLAPDVDAPDPLGGWHTFFSAYATEKGVPAEELIAARPFAPFFLQLTLAAHAARRARDEAARHADAPAGAGGG